MLLLASNLGQQFADSFKFMANNTGHLLHDTLATLALSGAALGVALAVTLPVAPAEAMLTDVVVARLRGRAASVRSAVRSLSTGGSVVIGFVSTLVGLRLALMALTPIYAIGGVLVLLALRTYPRDLAFVLAESRRRPY